MDARRLNVVDADEEEIDCAKRTNVRFRIRRGRAIVIRTLDGSERGLFCAPLLCVDEM